MTIAGDDIIMSAIQYVLSAPVQAKTPGGLVVRPLPESYPHLVVLPRALDDEPDTHGPRIGFRLPNERPDTVYYGGAQLYQWSLMLEVDAVIKGDDGQMDVKASLRTVYALKAALAALFTEGQTIPCKVFLDATDTNVLDAGAFTVLVPRVHAVSDYEAALICTLQKVVGPS